MNPTPILGSVVTMAVAACLGVSYGVRLFTRGVRLEPKADTRAFPLITVLGLAFVFGNTAFLVVWHRPHLAWYLPVLVQYWGIPFLRGLDVAVISFIFAAIATLAFRQRLRIRWVVPFLGMASLVAGELLIQNAPWFKPPKLGPHKETDGMILQTDYATCAAASCANIARYYGIETNERSMAELLGTTAEGTSVAQIVYGMRSLGFECRKRRIPDTDFAQVHAPSVLLVQFGNEPLSHAVAYMGMREGKAEIWNPQSGEKLGFRRATREYLARPRD